MSLPETPLASSAIDIRTTRPRLRDGLRFIPKSSHDGVAWFRIEDDANGRFHRIGLAEYEFLLALDGVRTIEQARERAAATSHQKHSIAPEQAESLLHWALGESLLAGQNASPQTAASRSKSSLAWIKLPFMAGNTQWRWPVSMAGWLFDSRAITAVLAMWCMASCMALLDHDRNLANRKAEPGNRTNDTHRQG